MRDDNDTDQGDCNASVSADHWLVTLLDQKTLHRHEITTKMIVNAAGPWVGELLGQTLGLKTNEGVRLVRGSHIVTHKLFDHDTRPIFFKERMGASSLPSPMKMSSR